MQRITVTLRLNACSGFVYHMDLLSNAYRLLVNKKPTFSKKRHVVVCVYTMLLQYDLHLGRSREGVRKWYAVDVRPTWL